MPHNPHQPRHDDGRFGSIPAQPPTAAPSVAGGRSVELPDLTDEQIVELYRRFTAIQAAATATQSTPSENSRPDAHRSDEREWARTYHVRFRNFDRRTMEATKELFRSRPSQLEPEQRKVVFKNWVDQISDIYGMERPDFRWDAVADSGGGGFYSPSSHSITMSPNHPSVITLIHETRHALQHKQKGAAMISDDVERDARAWSLSLYYKVRPNLLKRLVREGRVFHIDPSVFDD